MIVKEMELTRKKMHMLKLMIDLKKHRNKTRELIKMKMMTVMTIWMTLSI
jgi:hypothetical protein